MDFGLTFEPTYRDSLLLPPLGLCHICATCAIASALAVWRLIFLGGLPALAFVYGASRLPWSGFEAGLEAETWTPDLTD